MMISVEIDIYEIVQILFQLLYPHRKGFNRDQRIRFIGKSRKSSLSSLLTRFGILTLIRSRIIIPKTRPSLLVRSRGKRDIEGCPEDSELLMQCIKVLIALLDVPHKRPMRQLDCISLKDCKKSSYQVFFFAKKILIIFCYYFFSLMSQSWEQFP